MVSVSPKCQFLILEFNFLTFDKLKKVLNKQIISLKLKQYQNMSWQ